MSVTTGSVLEASERIVRRLYDAVATLDADVYAACYAVDCVSHDPDGAPPHLGRAAVREFFSGVGALCESCSIEAEAMYVGGNGAAVPFRVTARCKNGKEATVRGVDVITLSPDGLIQELHAYWDPSPLVATLSS